MLERKYRISCDGCGVFLTINGNVGYYDSPEEARREALEDGWTGTADYKIYCDYCRPRPEPRKREHVQ